jgi:hypothetical protein
MNNDKRRIILEKLKTLLQYEIDLENFMSFLMHEFEKVEQAAELEGFKKCLSEHKIVENDKIPVYMGQE